ncbi:MAG: hypothetical protein LCH77_12995 [Actinobacteria bacterium]|nr:hypothetical protein [Actinomycetota bacterium]
MSPSAPRSSPIGADTFHVISDAARAAPTTSKAATAAFNKLSSADQEAFSQAVDGAADAACRGPVRDLIAMHVATDLADFAETNADQLAAVQRDWAAMVSSARAYPEAASLGL